MTKSLATKLILLTLFVLAIADARAHAQQRNFVFFLVDDLGKMDIGIEGSQFYETPHIDALAESGMRFNHGYATCQVCSPPTTSGGWRTPSSPLSR